MYISLVLLVILLFGAVVGLVLYRFQGRKDLIHLDIVQFCYIFFFYPLFFVWLKSFVYVQLKSMIGINLSPSEYFVIDTTVATVGLYLYGIVAMKGLTKTLFLVRQKNPLMDLFPHTEYIHLWISHVAIFIGVVAILSVLSIVNLLFPFQVPESDLTNMLTVGLGIAFGLCLYIVLLLSNPQQDHFRLLKTVKLLFGSVFSLFVAVYLIMSPPLSPSYSLYWFSLFLFATFVVCSFFSYKSPRANSFMERITDLFRDYSWGNNITLFKNKKK